jgi:hypothetical protein
LLLDELAEALGRLFSAGFSLSSELVLAFGRDSLVLVFLLVDLLLLEVLVGRFITTLFML